MQEPAHSILGPSSADRWINCPGSVFATKDIPDTDTEYSLLGTAAHSLAERCRKDNLPAAHFLGGKLYVEKVDGESAEFVVDREMTQAVQSFIDYLNALPGDDYNESRVYYEDYAPGGFGTMDAARAEHTVLHIADYKHGEGVRVEAYDNPQLKLYALGFMLAWGWLYNFKRVVLHIVQPRLDNYSVHETTPEAIYEWAAKTVRHAATLAMSENAPFKAGAHCKFCKIRATCAVRAKYVFAMNLDELDDLDDAIAKDAPPIGQLTAAQIDAALRRKPHVISWYKDVEAHVRSEIAHGRELKGWKFVEGRANRDWAVPASEVEHRLVKAGITEGVRARLYTEQIISPAQAEAEFGKKLFLPGTANREAGPLADLVIKPRGKAKLAPPEDPRAPIHADASELEEVDGAD